MRRPPTKAQARANDGRLLRRVHHHRELLDATRSLLRDGCHRPTIAQLRQRVQTMTGYPPPSARTIAHHGGMPALLREAMDGIEDEIAAHVLVGGVVVSADNARRIASALLLGEVGP